MFKKIIYLIMAGLILLGLGGDWTRVEPEEMAVGMSFIYDKTDEGYKITGEFLNAGGSQSSQESQPAQTFLMDFEAKTVAEALMQNLQLEKAIFGTHTRVRFFTESLAQSGMEEIYDFFFREFFLDQRPMMMVIKGQDPKLIYEAETGLSDNVGSYIYALSQLKQESSTLTSFISTLDFAKDLYKEGKQPVMGVLQIEENELEFEDSQEEEKPKKYIMNFEGLAVFKDDKLVGYLNGHETLGYNFISDKVEQAYIAIPIGDETVTIMVLKSKPDITTEYVDDNITINVNIKNALAIAENASDYDITKIEEAKEVEEYIKNHLQQEIENAITKTQQDFSSDIFGFGDYFHIDYPKEWKRIKDRWDDDYFAKAQINVTVENEIDLEGHIRERLGERV